MKCGNTLISVRMIAFSIRRAVLDALKEDDDLLICKHVFEDHYRGKLYSYVGGKFTREDGSTGECKFTLLCPSCLSIPRREMYCHQWVFREGKVWIADRLPGR